MSWTHYWQRETELPPVPFTRASADCSRLLGQVGVPLAGMDGTGTPSFKSDAVGFNGVLPAAVEPFEIHQTEFDRRGSQIVRSFCKTQHAPYDLCVQLALIVFKHHLANAISVQSDGKDADWGDARETCQRILGYGEDFRLAPEGHSPL